MKAIYKYKVKYYNDITGNEEIENGILFADKDSNTDAVKQLEDYYGVNDICVFALEFLEEGTVFLNEEMKNYIEKDIDI